MSKLLRANKHRPADSVRTLPRKKEGKQVTGGDNSVRPICKVRPGKKNKQLHRSSSVDIANGITASGHVTSKRPATGRAVKSWFYYTYRRAAVEESKWGRRRGAWTKTMPCSKGEKNERAPTRTPALMFRSEPRP
jgi:hypothetical protein